MRTLYFYYDAIKFHEGFIQISNRNDIAIHISHNGVMPYLNEIKKDLFGEKPIKLNLQGNRLIEDELSAKFIGKIKLAKDFYISYKEQKGVKKLSSNKKRKDKINSIDKVEYQKILNLYHNHGSIITQNEYKGNLAIPDSILYQVKTRNNVFVFFWESCRNASTSTIVFVSDLEHYEEFLNRIQGFMSINSKSKRLTLNNDEELRRNLSYYDKIKHGNLEDYENQVKTYISSANFNYINTNSETQVQFLDSFFIQNTQFSLLDDENLSENSIIPNHHLSVRKYRWSESENIDINILDLHRLLDDDSNLNKNKSEFKIKLNNLSVWNSITSSEFNISVKNIIQYDFYRFVFFKLESNNGSAKKKISRSELLISRVTFLKLGTISPRV
jgi:hypothetical protein